MMVFIEISRQSGRGKFVPPTHPAAGVDLMPDGAHQEPARTLSTRSMTAAQWRSFLSRVVVSTST